MGRKPHFKLVLNLDIGPNEFYLEVHYEGTSKQDESIQRVLAERGKTVYATAVRAGAILVDNGNLKLLGDVKVFGR